MEKPSKQNIIEFQIQNFPKKFHPIPPFLVDSKLQQTAKNLNELKKIIQSQQYTYISLLSQERNIFCVKSHSNDGIYALQVKEVNPRSTCIYLSTNITPTLKKQLRGRFIMKNWRVNHKIYLSDDREYGLVLLQYDFASKDLRKYIQMQYQKQKKIDNQTIFQIFKDLSQNMCQYHLQNSAVNDIRPETIVQYQGKWFILPGDSYEKQSTQPNSNISKPIGVKSIPKTYLSPAIFQSIIKYDAGQTHNPFKSDVFSLGLIILQLESIGVKSKTQFMNFLENRNDFTETVKELEPYFREKFIFFGHSKQMVEVPKVLSQMLKLDENQRPYILEICLISNFKGIIMSKILPSYEDLFKILKTTNQHKRKLTYNHACMQYQGELVDVASQNKQNYQKTKFRSQTVRKGRGTMFHNGVKTYDGEWNNNIPNGKGNINFSNLWMYDGELKDGMLDGNGVLHFNVTRLKHTKWYRNLPIVQKQLKQLNFQKGFYMFVPDQNNTHKIFYKKLLNQNKIYIINLFLVSNIKDAASSLLILLENIGLKLKGFEIFGKQNNTQVNLKPYQTVRFYTQQNQYIQLIGNPNNIIPLALKVLKELNEKTIQKDNNNSFFVRAINTESLTQQIFKQIFDSINTLTSLNVRNSSQVNDNFIKILLIQKNCDRIEELDVSNTQISDKSISQILYAKFINKIRIIRFDNCKRLTADKLTDFICSQRLEKLEELSLQGSSLSHRNLEKIAKSSHLDSLKRLNLGHSHKISQSSLSQLLTSNIASQLKKLQIHSLTLKDSILQTMASYSLQCSLLQQLNLSGSINFSNFGLNKFFMSPNAQKLKKIGLSSTYINDQVLQTIARQSGISQNLTILNLNSCLSVNDTGIKHILAPEIFIKLQEIELSKTNISNQILYLMAAKGQRRLKSLNFSKCQRINDNGVEKLVSSQTLSNLSKLNLSSTGIKYKFFQSLQVSKYIKIQDLDISDCSLIDQKFLQFLFASDKVKYFTNLNISGTLIHTKTLQILTTNPFLENLYLSIDVSRCKNLGTESAQRLCLTNHFTSHLIRQQKLQKREVTKQLIDNPLLLKMHEFQISKELKNVHMIFRSQFLFNVHKISLNWIDTNQSIKSMVNSIHISNLKTVSFMGSKFEQQNLIDLLKSSTFKKVQHLDLSWTQISNRVLCSLTQSQYTSSLRALILAKCIKINDKGFQKLFSSQNSSNLNYLDLRSTFITNQTLQQMASSKHFKQLSVLIIRSCQNIKDNGLITYLKSKNASNLKTLDAGWINGISCQFLKSIIGVKCQQLQQLKICGLKNIDYQLVRFLQSPSPVNVKYLDIGYNQLNLKTYQAMAASVHFGALVQLDLSGIKFDSNSKNPSISGSLSTLVKAPFMKKVKIIKISYQGNKESMNKLVQLLDQNAAALQKLIVDYGCTESRKNCQRIIRQNKQYQGVSKRKYKIAFGQFQCLN